jgi:hypothetical protein
MQTKYKVSRVLPEHISVKFETTDSNIQYNYIFSIAIYADMSKYKSFDQNSIQYKFIYLYFPSSIMLPLQVSYNVESISPKRL